jgi:HlyD family secretion protein
VLLADGDQQLRSGMSVRAEIETEAAHGVPVVPIQAVVERPPLAAHAADIAPHNAGRHGASAAKPAPPATGANGDDEVSVVFVVAGGKARQRAVETGISDETHVEIAGGVKPGERVITGPYRVLRDLKDGDAIEIGTATAGDEGGGKSGDRRDGGTGDQGGQR